MEEVFSSIAGAPLAADSYTSSAATRYFVMELLRVTNLASYGPYGQPLAISDHMADQPRRFMLLPEDLVTFRTDNGVPDLSNPNMLHQRERRRHDIR